MRRRPSRDLEPSEVVASFDSASVLHAATAAALRGEPFPHLGSGRLMAAAVRVGGNLPWPVLRQIYTRIGGSEGIDAERLGDVDLAAVARAFADGYPEQQFPAIMVGSSNGALTHLAAALQIPWLPTTVLVPVAHVSDPQRPVDALDFGAEVGPRLLERNPDVGLHQMHDAVQDTLMAARMAYFRVKWQRLPEAYATFISERLLPGGQVILVDDESPWPVTRVSDRHVFQVGGQGGITRSSTWPARTPHSPTTKHRRPNGAWSRGSAPTW